MIGRARWILIGAAMMLVAVAFSWSCGGGGSPVQCVTTITGTTVCGLPGPPGPSLQSISICPGAPPSPTPIPTSSAVPSPTPIEPTCAPTVVAAAPTTGVTLQFHAVGTFSDGSTQDITNNASTISTSDYTSVAMPNTSPGGQYYAAGNGCAQINAISGSIAGVPAVMDVLPIPSGTSCPTPAPSPGAADLFGP